MAKRITEGPFKGYFTIPQTLLREEQRSDVVIGQRDLWNDYRALQLSLNKDDNVFHRYSPGPANDVLRSQDTQRVGVNTGGPPPTNAIGGFNRTLFPRIDGFYYVKRNPDVDLRQQLYALENRLVPSTGNTEVFNLGLDKVRVPQDWCPYLLDPCPDELEWCRRCRSQPKRFVRETPVTLFTVIARWTILLIFSTVIGALLTLAFRSN